MKTVKSKLFVLVVLICVLFWGPMIIETSFAQPNSKNIHSAELRNSIRKFKTLLQRHTQEAVDEGIDMDRVRELDRKSKNAAREGRIEDAVGFLEQAISILEKTPDLLERKKMLSQKSPGTAREMAQRQLSSQDVLRDIKNNQALVYFDSPFGFIEDVTHEPYLGELNVHWIRGTQAAKWDWIEKKRGVYDWSIPDHYFLSSFNNGINTALEIRVINDLYGATRENPYPDGNMDALSDFVRNLVERYDGDGIDDAPGSPVIKLYQFIHELAPPLPKDHGNKNRKEYYRSNVEHYIKLFHVIYKAMKAACPDAKLMLAGTTKIADFSFKGDTIQYPDGMNSFVPLDEDGFFVKVLRGLDRSYTDIAIDYHIWVKAKGAGYKMHQNFISEIRNCYKRLGYEDIDIMSMEAGTTDHMDGATEKDQAISVVKIYVSSLALGQKKLFWTTVYEYDWSQEDTSIFDFTGLINNERNTDGKSHKKLAFFTYKLMVEKLEGTAWDKIETIVDGTDNVYMYRFTEKGSQKSVYVVWWDRFDKSSFSESASKSVTLDIMKTDRIRITDSITDAAGIRMIWEKAVDNGKVELSLNGTPLFIEPVN